MLIVDTYNVLHVSGVLPPNLVGLDVPGLVRLISTSRYANRRITLVCDGGPSGPATGVRMYNVRILYAGAHLEADDVIEQLIERYHHGNPLQVVSTDRRLRRAARKLGARSVTSECFLTQLIEDKNTLPPKWGDALRKQVPLDAYSVDMWFREFGMEPPHRGSAGDTGRQKPGEVIPVDRVAKRKKRMRPAAKSEIGERLRIELPKVELPEEGRPESAPTKATQNSSKQAEPEAICGQEQAKIDPLLLEALEEWRDRLTLDDLDMQRWIPDADPDSKPSSG